MSLYEKLGVPNEASKDDIKKAFRKLSLEHHPDRGGDQEKRLQERENRKPCAPLGAFHYFWGDLK